MALPDFNSDEQYLVNSVKSPKAAGDYNVFMWGYILGGGLLAGFAAYLDNTMMMLAAFVIVSSFRVHEERYHRQWMPVWRSVIEKYEAAAMATDARASTDSESNVSG